MAKLLLTFLWQNSAHREVETNTLLQHSAVHRANAEIIASERKVHSDTKSSGDRLSTRRYEVLVHVKKATYDFYITYEMSTSAFSSQRNQ